LADQIIAQYENGILELKFSEMAIMPDKIKTIKVV